VAQPRRKIRAVHRSTRSAAAAIVCLVLFVACGGSSDAGVGEDFAARARHVCDQALESKEAWAPFPVADFDPTHPDASAFPKVADWLEHEVKPTFDGWLSGLEALGQPPDARDAWDGVLAAVGNIVDLNEKQIAAARTADASAFADATDALGQAQTTLVRVTDEAGVSSCADVHA
jgi:hypothetical protein